MATETLTINFKASGDKALIDAFKGIANAQKVVTAAAKKNDKATKALVHTVRNASPAYRRLTAQIQAAGKTFKDIGISKEIATKAALGNRVAIEKLRNAHKRATAQTRILGGAFSVLRSKLLIFSFGAGLASKAILDQVKAFGIQQDSVERLAVAFGQDGARALDDYSSELQKVTTFGDEVTNVAMATIGMYGASAEATMKLTKGTMDLATALGMDLVGASQLVAKTIGSSTNALSRYGITIDATASQEEKAAQATAELERVFGGLAEAMARTTQGQITQAQNALGDLQEVVGGLLAPTVVFFAKALKLMAEALQNPIILGASVTFAAIATSTALASAGVTGFTAVTKLATIAQTAFNVVANANPYVLLGSVMLGVAAAVGTYMVGTRELTAEQKKQIEATEAAAKADEEAKKAAEDYAKSLEDVEKSLEKKIALLKAGTEIEKFAIENDIKLADVNEDLFNEYQALNAELEEEQRLQKLLASAYNSTLQAKILSLEADVHELQIRELNGELTENQIAGLRKLEKNLYKLYDAQRTVSEGSEELTSLTQQEVALFNEFAELLTNVADRRIESLQQEFQARLEISNATISQINQEKDAELAAIDDIFGRRASTHAKRLELEKETIAKHKERVDAELANQEKLRKETNKALVKQFRIKQSADIAGTIIATQRAYMETLGKTGFFGIPLAKIVLAQGALAVAAIAAQKPPKMEQGGLIGGRRHSQGGTMIEAEQGEFIVNRNAVQTVGLETLNRINQGQSQRSINISFQGNVMSKDFLEDEAIPQIKEALRRGGDIGVN
ncbi:MAG: hypothetical protein GOVbin1434_35 [Prokaryotic dsDNA virus sp.]|nr:MAG: hypothetical protein GOVbin1434_35 [Prokaryotic dsDNA virus sp.]|tara:strand:+ start:6656 stop:9043 length:2388 start_codon:yes stop_codon:yes gene_type:complete